MTDFDPQAQLVLALTVMGQTPDAVARSTGMTLKAVKETLALPENKTRLADLSQRYVTQLLDRQIRETAIPAARVFQEVISSQEASDADKITAAKYIIDRLKGKPTQNIDTPGGGFSSLVRKLQDLESLPGLPETQVIDVPVKVKIDDGSGN